MTISALTNAFLRYEATVLAAAASPITSDAMNLVAAAEEVWLAAAKEAAEVVAAEIVATGVGDPLEARTLAEEAAKVVTQGAPWTVQATIILRAGNAACAAVVASPAYQADRDQELAGGWTLEEVVRPTAVHLHAAAERKWGSAFTLAKADWDRYEHVFLDNALDRPFAQDDRWGRD